MCIFDLSRVNLQVHYNEVLPSRDRGAVLTHVHPNQQAQSSDQLVKDVGSDGQIRESGGQVTRVQPRTAHVQSGGQDKVLKKKVQDDMDQDGQENHHTRRPCNDLSAKRNVPHSGLSRREEQVMRMTRKRDEDQVLPQSNQKYRELTKGQGLTLGQQLLNQQKDDEYGLIHQDGYETEQTDEQLSPSKVEHYSQRTNELITQFRKNSLASQQDEFYLASQETRDSQQDEFHQASQETRQSQGATINIKCPCASTEVYLLI